ncbi:hypothetical protein H6P81_010053 [Aristolochia fimbriata]|uniref:Uncharacterized protein n=1 Tax=Aristolochia fimbriata TaxID=158543 RepID=A0AAV7EMY0_ARIFI|nr:hypothetical protein H6P81_010053 [Aristolochia fimbriata]
MDSRLTTRCSPVFFLETIQKAKLKEKHIRAIKKTPFGHFLEVKGGHIDLNGLKEYAWGEALHRHIVLQLSRKKAKNNGYFTGCALAVTLIPQQFHVYLSGAATKYIVVAHMKKFTSKHEICRRSCTNHSSSPFVGGVGRRGRGGCPPTTGRCYYISINANLESKIGKMEATLEDVQLKMVVMQARLDGAPEEAPAAEEASAAPEEAPTVAKEALAAEDAIAAEDTLAAEDALAPKEAPVAVESAAAVEALVAEQPSPRHHKRKVKPSQAMTTPYVLTHTSKRTKKTNC